MEDKDVRKYLRAAGQRLTSAQILYENSVYLDCTYLAGYAAECALKAVILARTPQKERQTCVQGQFRGAEAHNCEHLKDMLKKRSVTTSSISAALTKVATWSTDFRYEVGSGDPRDAEEFLRAVNEIYNWAKRSAP